MSLRVLIVDDEPLARRRLRRLLGGLDDIEVAGECGDGPSAVDRVRSDPVDILLLDIQMPGMDGFQVLESLGEAPLPAVIFVTAHDQHAVRAFEVHALDYLLKPCRAERLAAAIARARERLGGGLRERERAEERLRALLAGLGQRPRRPERIAVKRGGRTTLVPAASIDWIEAAGKQVVLHAGATKHRLRATVEGILEQLDPARFARIHRSTIVQIDRIREVEPAFHGDCIVRLEGGKELALSRTYRRALEEALGQRL